MMMTMQMSSTVQSQGLRMFQARTSSFKRVSPLNPASDSLKLVTSTDSTRLHLANLDKLLQTKQQQPPTPTDEIEREKPDNNERKSKTMLERLNLARVWPEMKATEEMSPRHMNRLQRLLSMTQERSPRNVLGRRWREYHGCDDWKGMLDPLDENLRREVVRYGELVQAAYHTFHSNPDAPPPNRHVALPDRSYRFTKSLYATSSVGLPGWADELGWMAQRSSWVGFVAVCDDRREIARMGRRDIVISLRGTATCLEWAENMRAHLADMEGEEGGARVGCGFQSLYRTGGAHVASLAESVREEVERLMEMYKGEEISITVTGHSLGAALALLVADDVSDIVGEAAPVAVFSFGGPRVGNKRFGDRITDKKVKVLRIVNSQDVITRVPGMFVSEEVEEKVGGSNVGGVFDMLEKYAHVGAELRLDTKMSPYLKPDADMACCHDLEAYLHLVDGFMASNCPFRSNAKRSLVRLLKDQGSNIKHLYTEKAKALSVRIERQTSFSMSTCCPSPS